MKATAAARRLVHAAPPIQRGSSVSATGRASERSQRSAERVALNGTDGPRRVLRPDRASTTPPGRSDYCCGPPPDVTLRC